MYRCNWGEWQRKWESGQRWRDSIYKGAWHRTRLSDISDISDNELFHWITLTVSNPRVNLMEFISNSSKTEGLFTQKILVHSQKNLKKIQRLFFEELKSAHLILEWTTARFQCLNPFLCIKSSYSQKNPEKNSKKSKDFFEDLKSIHPIWEWPTHRPKHCLFVPHVMTKEP